MADAVPPHKAAFEAQLDYMIDSIDAGSLAPACLSEGLISERQRDKCFRESSSFDKAELLLGYVKQSIIAERTNFDTFVAILRRKGHGSQADKLTQQLTSKQSSGGAAAGAQPGTSQVSAFAGLGDMAIPKRRIETEGDDNNDEIPLFPMEQIDVIQNKHEPVKPSKDQHQAVIDFAATEVKVVIQSCNKAEYTAALEAIERPPLPLEFDKPVRYPSAKFTIVVGTFAGQNAVIVRTDQGSTCRGDLTTLLSPPFFPNATMLLGLGVCMGIKHKLGDVLVGEMIQLEEKPKVRQGKLQLVGTRKQAKQTMRNVFCDTTGWNNFKCTDVPKVRISEAFSGCILSSPNLLDDCSIKHGLESETQPLIGAEMEGWVLFKDIEESFPNIESIIIKGICDYGDGTKNKDWQLTAAKAAVDYARFKLDKNAF